MLLHNVWTKIKLRLKWNQRLISIFKQMTPEQKQQLETLTYKARMYRMVELGRLARSDRQVATTLNTLEKGDEYDRLLALQSCYGSGDGEQVLRCVTDASRQVRCLALRLLPVVGDDRQVLAVLNTATYKQRRTLLRKLLNRGRRSCIDTFINSLAEEGSAQLSRLLPLASASVVMRHLDTVLDGSKDWQLLTRQHPTIATDLLLSQAEAASDFDPRLLYQVNAVLPRLTEFSPDQALTLCRSVSRTISLGRLNSLQTLVWRRPQEFADLILQSSDRVSVNFDQVAHKLDLEQLIALITHRKNTVNTYNILSRLTPENRQAVYDVCGDWRSSDGCIASEIIALLPRHIREQEARYHLNLPVLATRPTQRLPYVAFLPWDEVVATLDSFVRNPDPDLRVAALTVLVSAVRYNRSHVPDILAIVQARRNEQDPVRCAMLTGFADLPPSIWRAEHLDLLSQVITDALNAADLSNATGSAVESLIVAILPFHPAWSTQQLVILVQKRGQVSFYNLGDRLTDADILRIATFLLPILQTWERSESEVTILNVARSLGRRLRVFDSLVKMLERIIQNTRNQWIAVSALSILALHRRERLQQLIPELVKQDPSWVTQPIVYNYLHRHRQDLLTPFLGQLAYSGRFSTGKTRFVLPFVKGFGRWTPTQQRIFAATLNEITQDEQRDTPTLLRVITQLAALPSVAPARLIELASHLNTKLAVRDAALRALSQLDTGLGIPTLITAMDDDRARIAIYALRRSLMEMPVKGAVQLLLAVPMTKVTVAKEVVRLLGDLGDETAYRELLALDSRELHRDVRVALVRALWSHLEREETWYILERAAISDDPAIATVVGRIPADRLSADAGRHLISVLATLLGHSDPLVRLDVLRRCVQLPVADSEVVLLPKLLRAINSPLPDESAVAANAVFTTYSGKYASVVGNVVKSIIANRGTLQQTVVSLIAQVNWNRRHLLPTARTVLDVLATDPLTASLRVSLAIAALPGEELVVVFEQLAAGGEMHAEVLFDAVQKIGSLNRNSISDLTVIEVALAISNDDRLRRLALAALVVQSQAYGWNEERKEKLHVFRHDPSPMVAAAAQFTFLHDD